MMRGNGAAVTVARHGVAGAIQATRATYERLRDRYLFQERGHIEVKGKGQVTAHLLLGRVAPAVSI